MSTASVLDVFRAVASATAAASLRWYLFGAQAVLAYGAPRLTLALALALAEACGLKPVAFLKGCSRRPRRGELDSVIAGEPAPTAAAAEE